MRLKQAALLLPLVLLTAPGLRAEYIVLRSGQRLTVTGYQLVGDKYRLQMAGGSVEVAAEEVVTIEPEEVFTPVPAKPVVKPPYRELIEAAASRYKVDADLISSVIAVESNFDPKAVSRKNARGLMQLLPETAARLGVKNMDDPKENIEAGTRYLSELLQMYNCRNAFVCAPCQARLREEQVECIPKNDHSARSDGRDFRASDKPTPVKIIAAAAADSAAAAEDSAAGSAADWLDFVQVDCRIGSGQDSGQDSGPNPYRFAYRAGLPRNYLLKDPK